ncbi:hypothetical protein COCNU_scaffold002568G000010 [Cocos nucifera]|nr:hypothetical protein [Cocos nucifera]
MASDLRWKVGLRVGDVVLVARKWGERTDEALEAMDHNSAIVKEVRPGDLDVIDEDLEGDGGGVVGSWMRGCGGDGEVATGAGSLKFGAEGEVGEVDLGEEVGDEVGHQLITNIEMIDAKKAKVSKIIEEAQGYKAERKEVEMNSIEKKRWVVEEATSSLKSSEELRDIKVAFAQEAFIKE